MTGRTYTFGLAYQHKLLGACFRSPGFLRKVYDCIRAEWFETTALGVLAGMLRRYHDKHGSSPTPEAIRLAVDEYCRQDVNSGERAAMLRATFEEACSVSLDELPDVLERVAEFAQRQAHVDAIMASADAIERGDYEEVMERMARAAKVGVRQELGLSFFHDQRSATVTRDRIPTGWPSIDKKLRGGPGRGDSCVLIGASGTGKSFALQSIGVSALEAGWDVVYYTLELSVATVDERINVMMGTMRVTEQDRAYARSAVHAKLRSNMHVMFFPQDSATVSDLRRHFDVLCAEGKLRKQKTLVIVDYGMLLRAGRSEGQRDDMIHRQKYLELGQWAQEDQLVVWTAQQTGRSGALAERVSATDIGDAWKIVCDSRVVLTMTSNREQRMRNTAYMQLAKATDSDGVDGIEVMLTWHDDCNRRFENLGYSGGVEADDIPPPVEPHEDKPKIRRRKKQ